MSAQYDLTQWNGWKHEIHESDIQKKRQFRAYAIRADAVRNGEAWRVGSYNVTLTSCDCPDFYERRLPCKHIYAAAISSGISLPAVTGEQWEIARNQNLKIASKLGGDNSSHETSSPVRIYHLKAEFQQKPSDADGLALQWRNDPTSNRQQKVLRFFGIDFTADMTKGRAAAKVTRLFRNAENEGQWRKYEFLAHDFGHDSPLLQPFVRDELEFFGLPLDWVNVDPSNGPGLRGMVKQVVLPPEWMWLREAVFDKWHLGRGIAPAQNP